MKRVKANKGVAGVDGLDIEQTAHVLQTSWPRIRQQLTAGKYRPSLVRRVMVPKADGSQRELGIPTVVDRLIQQALLQVLQPQIDPSFSNHSHGFRPGRRAHDAVKAARAYVQSGKRVVVDVDLAKFFDRVNHDILLEAAPKAHRRRWSDSADSGVPERRNHGRRGSHGASEGHAARRAAEPFAGQRAARRGGQGTGTSFH